MKANFRTGIFFIAAIFLIHLITIRYDLYNQFVNFDIVMHLLGGFATAVFAYAYLSQSLGVKNGTYLFKILFIVGFTVLIGVAWELMEYQTDSIVGVSYNWTPMTLRDTLGDLIMDILGAFAAGLVYIRNN